MIAKAVCHFATSAVNCRRNGTEEASAISMSSSLVQLAEDSREGQGEEFTAKLVGGVQHPFAPVFGVRRHHHRAYQALGVDESLAQIHGSTASIDEDVFGVGAVEI